MVGSAIVRELKRQGYENILTRTHGELDLTRQADVEKFFAAEFSTLKQSTAQILSRNDDGVLSSFQKQYAAITDFQSRLTERIALWNKQKADAEELFAQMEHEVAQNFNDPIDRYNEEKDLHMAMIKDYFGKGLVKATRV